MSTFRILHSLVPLAKSVPSPGSAIERLFVRLSLMEKFGGKIRPQKQKYCGYRLRSSKQVSKNVSEATAKCLLAVISHIFLFHLISSGF